MLWFPPAKINLGLAVLHKRLDGYHSIETLLYPIPLFDLLEINKNPTQDTDIFSSSGLILDCRPEENLVWKALRRLRKEYKFPSVKIHLHKQIPVGSGLGGASSDAAYILLGIKWLFDLSISPSNLNLLAAEIGSDCPFFLKSRPRYIRGKGELLEDFYIHLAVKKLALVIPNFSISTKDAYQDIVPKIPAIFPFQALQMEIENWKKYLKNDFEERVFRVYPDLAKTKEELYRAGAHYVSLSGSGSGIFGLFESETELKLSAKHQVYWMTLDD
ncbi:MAG TPA: 4-(cytidine 5'-diphospho)-2-C-methyl-D-erythritol kinase [Bacteroidales bacterium]|nr:4-(cytidine 5'-diphospho)-2-C-methyl-D-erythritol kinase [Bacteroidales bacterium]